MLRGFVAAFTISLFAVSSGVASKLSTKIVKATTTCQLISWVDNISGHPFVLLPGDSVETVGSYSARISVTETTRTFGIAKTNSTQILNANSDRTEKVDIVVDSDYASLLCSSTEENLTKLRVKLLTAVPQPPASREIKEQIVHIVTHPSSTFDGGISKPGAVKLRDFTTARGIQTIMLSQIKKPDSTYYLTADDVSQTLFSAGGSHNLGFKSAPKKILLSGGFLDLCMCETFRDIVRTVVPDHTVEIIVPLEATTASQVSDFYSAESEGPSTLATLFEKASAEEILSFVSTKVWGLTDDGAMPPGFLCPFQNSRRPVQPVKSSDYTVEVLLVKQGPEAPAVLSLGVIGNGTKRIRLIFTPTQALSQLIK